MDDFEEANRGVAGSRPGIEARASVAPPPLYKVLMLNDDFTPADFVIGAIETCFGKARDEAVAIARTIHRAGVGVCGVFTYDIAETRMMLVIELAREHRHPLQCMIEPA